MITTVTEAISIVTANKIIPKTESIDLEEAHGRILAEDIIADRDYPPFDRVSMDGIAICLSDDSSFNTSLTAEGIQQAGQERMTLQNQNHCIEVMTGASLPIGCNTVIRYEDVIIADGIFKVDIIPIKGINIHPRASDVKQGALVMIRGTKIHALAMGVLASLGYAKVKVLALPKIAIIASGDELVAPDIKPLDHQIRTSNPYTIQALLDKNGLKADVHHVKDDRNDMVEFLRNILDDCDVLLLSGGVSAGKFDFIPEVLAELKVEKLFHKVEQRPGKPFWFGRKDHKIVFGYPGNPMSSFVCHQIYFEEWWASSLGQPVKKIQAFLKEDIPFKPDIDLFALGKLSQENGHFYFEAIASNGSGDFISPLFADAIVHLPRGKSLYAKGELYNITRI